MTFWGEKKHITPPEQDDFCIIITTQNRAHKSLQCLSALNKIIPTIPVVLVEDGSRPQEKLSPSEVHKKHPHVSYIEIKKSRGIAAARNIGIQKVPLKTKWIIFLDDDATITNFPIQAIQECITKYPDTGIIAPLITYPNGSPQESVRSDPTILSLLWRGSRLYTLFPNASWYRTYVQPPLSVNKSIDWSIGACLLIKKDIFETIGLFDEKFRFGYEDADICVRARKTHMSIRYVPAIQVIHEYARTSASGINKRLIQHILSIIRFFFKHRIY